MSVSIVRAFMAHAVDAGIQVTRDAAIKMKQAELGEIRAARMGSDAIEAARAKSVSVCKKVVTDFYTDGYAELEHIDAAMQVLADAWGKGITKVDVPESVKVANEQLMAWRKTL
jgi:hypothetical protein